MSMIPKGVVQKIKSDPLALKIAKTPKVMRQFLALFRVICPECRAKVLKNPQMDIGSYCLDCQEKAKYRLERVKEVLNDN